MPPAGHLMAEQDAQNSIWRGTYSPPSPYPAWPGLIKLLTVSISQPLSWWHWWCPAPVMPAFLLDTCLTPWNHSLKNESHQLFIPPEKNPLYSIPRKELCISTIRFSAGSLTWLYKWPSDTWRCSTSLTIREMQIKTLLRHHLTPFTIAVIKMIRNKCWQ